VTGFEFAHPAVLWALLLLPLWAVWRWRVGRRAAVAAAHLQHRPSPRRHRWPAALVLPLEVLLLTAAIVTAAGPRSVETVERWDDPGVDVMLVLDVSLSMLAEDFPPSRLAVLRELAGDLVDRGGGNRFGLVVFAGDAYVQSPMTTDTHVLRSLLDGVGAHMLNQGVGGGTAIGDALLVAADRLAAARVPGRDQAVVLITDGESNVGADPVAMARHLGEQGVRFHALGLGGTEPVAVTFEGEPVGPDGAYLAVLDAAELEAMASAAGGRFHRVIDATVLETVFDELSRLESAPLTVRRLDFPRSHVPMLALALLLLFAGHLTLAGVVARRPYR